MTTIVGTRFDLTSSIATGTAALMTMINTSGINANSQMVFGVVGNELVVYTITYP